MVVIDALLFDCVVESLGFEPPLIEVPLGEGRIESSARSFFCRFFHMSGDASLYYSLVKENASNFINKTIATKGKLKALAKPKEPSFTVLFKLSLSNNCIFSVLIRH